MKGVELKEICWCVRDFSRMDTLKPAVIHTVPLKKSQGMLTYHLDLHKQLLLVKGTALAGNIPL